MMAGETGSAEPHARDGVATRVAHVVATVFSVDDPSAIGETTGSDDVDGWDSLGHNALIMELEEEFGISLAAGDAVAARTVGDLTRIVADALDRRAAAR
jgi:acyl carrier protein